MKKFRTYICFLFLAFALFLSFPVLSTKADFGNYSGDSDYGSSWGDDSGGYSSYDDDGGFFFIGGGSSDDEDSGDWMMSVVIFIILLLFILIQSKRNSKSLKKNAPGSTMPGAVPENAANLRPIEEYQTLDPNFDEEAFKDRLSNLYVQMQNAWTKKDISSLQPYFSDTFFNQMNRQLQAMIKNKQTNYVDRIAVLGVEIKGFMQTGKDDLIIVQLTTRIVDYTLSDETGVLISGNKKTEKFMTYEWTLARSKGEQTAETIKMKAVHCPSCGAPVNINETAKCPYCDTVITVDTHDFVITAIKGISQVSGK